MDQSQNKSLIVDSRGKPLAKSYPGDCGDNAESGWRGPFWGVGELGGFHELTAWEDGWQRNLSPWLAKACGAVYACKWVIARAIANMTARHMRRLNNGGREEIKTSPLSRMLRNPNWYQTRSDFFLNLVFELLTYGNAYVLVYRDNAARIESMHIVPASSTEPYVVSETGEVFYAVGNNPLIGDIRVLVPARDVMHIRMHTPHHPLIGVSPIKYATLAVSINTNIASNQGAFFSNMSRPSGVLTTEEKLTKEQMDALRQAWYSKSKGLNAGEVPILGWGLKWNPMTITSEDAQLIEAYRMSIEDIARVFDVPLAMIGQYTQATYNNTEQLINNWLSQGLGFHMTHIELAIGRLFRSPEDEYVHFDETELLRTDFAGRIDGLTKGIIGGLYSPNEARNVVGLPEVEYGDEPRLQQQVVPLSQVGMMPDPAPAPDAPPPAPNTTPADDNADSEERGSSLSVYQQRALAADTLRNLIAGSL